MFVIGGFILALLYLPIDEPVWNHIASNRTEILNVTTDLPKMGNWWIARKGVEKMTITVTAKNTETVLFWLIPTGTQTWGQRELIGYDIDGNNGWSLTWTFHDHIFHDHIHVQAIGNETLSNDVINVSSYP